MDGGNLKGRRMKVHRHLVFILFMPREPKMTRLSTFAEREGQKVGEGEKWSFSRSFYSENRSPRIGFLHLLPLFPSLFKRAFACFFELERERDTLRTFSTFHIKWDQTFFWWWRWRRRKGKSTFTILFSKCCSSTFFFSFFSGLLSNHLRARSERTVTGVEIIINVINTHTLALVFPLFLISRLEKNYCNSFFIS